MLARPGLRVRSPCAGLGSRRQTRTLVKKTVLAYGILGGVLIAALPFEEAVRSLSPQPDLRVALFTLALALITGVLSGLLPAFHATRLAIAPTLKNEAGGVLGGTRPFRFRKGLVVAQIALSLLLLVGAGLFVRSLANLRSLDPGFTPERLVGVYRWQAKDVTFLRFCFSGRLDGVEARALDKEIVATHWLTLEELKARAAMHRSPLVQKCVEDYVAGRSYPLEVFSSEYP